MRILRYILATLAVLATFTACREEDELNKAKGRVVLGEIRIEAEEANTRAIAIPTPQPEDLTIEIIDPDGYTIERKDRPLCQWNRSFRSLIYIACLLRQ